MKVKYHVELDIDTDASEQVVKEGLKDELEQAATYLEPDLEADNFEITNVQVTLA